MAKANNKPQGYPEFILRMLREYDDLEPTDKSRDSEFNQLPPDVVWERVLNWEGIINYSVKLKSWVEAIYKVSLD